MANGIIERIKLKHYYSMLDKAVSLGNLVSFYHVVNARNLDIKEPEVFNRLIKLLESKKADSEIIFIDYLINMNIDVPTILSNKVLRNVFLEYYHHQMINERFLNYSSITHHEDLLNQLLEDEAFKGELSDKLNIQEYGLRLLTQSLRAVDRDGVEISQKNIKLLQTLGFSLDEDQLFDLMLKSESNQTGLFLIGLIDRQDIARLYHYKFEKLKEWYKKEHKDIFPKKIEVSEYIEPDPEDEMATYWFQQTRKLGCDALEFVFSRIRDHKGKDVFSEGDIPQLFEEWKKDHEYSPNPKKEFYSELDKNTGRLFTKEGLPTSILFTCEDYDLHMLREIIDYNWENCAESRYYYKEFPELVVRFLINNIDRIPKKYQFIFRKLDELSQIDDYYLASRIQKEFLIIITGGHRMHDNPLVDENGFTPRFYETLLFEKHLDNIDIIDPDWRSHLTPTHLLYIEKYKNRIDVSLLATMYEEERNKYHREQGKEGRYVSYQELEEVYPSLTYTELVDKYFTEKGPKRELIVYMLQNIGLRITLLEIETNLLLDEERAYLKFLKEIGNPKNINVEIKDIKKYFDANGPKDAFSKYLFELQEYDIIIDAKLEYQNILKSKETKILDEYKKVDDPILKKVYKDFIKEHKEEINDQKIDLLASVLKRISKSNSTEMLNLRGLLAIQLLNTEDPIKNLDAVEQIFLKNNLPTVGKIYSVFSILHPKFDGFKMDGNSMISPILQQKGNRSREMIVFSDLLRATMGSNNRSMINYLKSIKKGNDLYKRLKNGETEFTDKERIILDQFLKHLITLYNNTLKGKLDDKDFIPSGDYLKDINELVTMLSPNGEVDYNLADRLVDMFCHFAGITSLEEAEEYMLQKRAAADKRNRETTRLELEQGDFVKGIGGVTHLGHILQNGSVSKEYLGAYSTSDATPLDTDLSMILEPKGTVEEAIASTEARGYGPIWFVLKNDDRFAFTRRSPKDPEQTVTTNPPISKFETFYTGVCGEGHYGIRTGFASSEINAIIVENWDKRIALEIAMNGFYIPVFNTQGKLVFSAKNYDALREKMRGLDEYSTPEYIPSNELLIPGVKELTAQIPASIDDVIKKRKAINKAIQEALTPLGITIKDHYDGDLSEGLAELIDTGSTGRFTNMPGDGDFDFMLKLDRKIMEDSSRLSEVKTRLLKAFNVKGGEGVIGTGDFRLKEVHLDGLDVPVDIDITFETKTDKIAYSTDESLKDRLSSIKETHPQEYLLIVSNILLAKKLLKKFEVYKPNRGDTPEGGLGGVGIENWILQNGGSLKQAAESFLAVAEGKTFEEFRNTYVIWDFGENHLVTRKDIYPHDNFTYNMSAEGFEKMKKVLKEFLKTINYMKEDEKIEDVINNMSK